MFPTKWKAEIAMSVFTKKARVSDFRREARRFAEGRPDRVPARTLEKRGYVTKKIFVLALSFISLFLFESCPRQIKSAFVYFYLTSPHFSFEKITVHINSLSVRDSSGNRIIGSVNRTMTLDPELIPYTTVGRTIYPDQDFKDRIRKPGNYSGDQMVIDSGQVTVGGVTYSLQIPNPVVDVTGEFLVEAGLNNYIQFIIDVDKSILADGLGGFILKPIIRVSKQGS